MRRGLLDVTIVSALLLSLTLVVTWPLLPNITRAASDPGDPYINTFILDWNYYQTFRSPLDLFDAPIFFPARRTLAFSEHLYGLSILGFPFRAAGLAPLTTYNILFLLGFPASGIGAYVLSRHLVRSRLAAAIAAVAYTFIPYRLGQASHLQHVWSIWLPLSLWALLRLAGTPSVRRAAIFAAIVLMLGLSNVHWFLFGGVALGLTFLILMIWQPEETRRRFFLLTTVAAFSACLLLLPFFLPYLRVSEHYGLVRPYSETLRFSSQVSDWLAAPATSYLYARGAETSLDGERRLFPGVILIVATCLAFLGMVRRVPPTGLLPDSDDYPRPRTLLDLLIVGLLAMAVFIGARGSFRLGPMSIADATELYSTVLVLAMLRLAFTYRLADYTTRVTCILCIWVVVGFLGSLGLHSFFHRTLFTDVSLFRAIRVPARWR